MLNPARVPFAVVGVYKEELMFKMAKALQSDDSRIRLPKPRLTKLRTTNQIAI